MLWRKKNPERIIPRIIIENPTDRHLEIVAKQLADELEKRVEEKKREKLREQMKDKPGEFLGAGCVVWIAILLMIIFFVAVLSS